MITIKVHSRRKRLLGLTTGKRHRYFFHKVEKQHGPKTFRTRNGAEAHAKSMGLKKFEIVNAKKNKFSVQVR